MDASIVLSSWYACILALLCPPVHLIEHRHLHDVTNYRVVRNGEEFSNTVELCQNSWIRPSIHMGYPIGFFNPKHQYICRCGVFFIGWDIACAIAIKDLYVGKPSGKKPLHSEKVSCMPSIYLSWLATQGWGLGSQGSLYSIWVIEVGSSHICCRATIFMYRSLS